MLKNKLLLDFCNIERRMLFFLKIFNTSLFEMHPIYGNIKMLLHFDNPFEG